MSDTHSDLSSTTSTMSTLSYPDRIEQENMQRSQSGHFQRNSYSFQNDDNRGPHSPSQLVPPSNQRNRSVLARFPQNQENGESGYGAHWSEQGTQMTYSESAPLNGESSNHRSSPSAPSSTQSSTFEDQIRQQSLKLQRKSAAQNHTDGVDMTDDAHVRPPPPPMPPPPPPTQAPPAPPLPAVGSVKENVAK
jgi:hypothetical protein